MFKKLVALFLAATLIGCVGMQIDSAVAEYEAVADRVDLGPQKGSGFVVCRDTQRSLNRTVGITCPRVDPATDLMQPTHNQPIPQPSVGHDCKFLHPMWDFNPVYILFMPGTHQAIEGIDKIGKESKLAA
jgi:hypothetical protein